MSGRLSNPRLDWLDHPLVGRRRWLSAVAAAYCAVTIAATAAAVPLYAAGVDAIPGWPIRLVDGFTAVLIIGAVLSATVLPVIYGLVNRGPVMAAAVGLTPYLTAGVLYLDYTLTNDLVVALIGSSTGATVAAGMLWFDAVRRPEGSTSRSDQVDGLLVASGLTVVAGVAAWRFGRAAPDHMVATIDPFHWLVLVPVVGCILLGVAVRSAQSASR